MSKTILCFGDSWTGPYKSSIPYDTTWPHKLKKYEHVEMVHNLGIASASNDGIIEHCIKYLTTEYISINKSLDDVIVIVGWSSPCRKDFYFDTKDGISWDTLWPCLSPSHKYSQPMKEMYQIYVKYFWNEYTMFKNYVNHVLYLQSFLKSLNVKYLMFNAFYQYPISLELYPNKQPLEMSIDTVADMFKKFNKILFGGKSSITREIHSDFGSVGDLAHIDGTDLKLWNTAIDKNTYYKNGNLSSSFKNFLNTYIQDEAWYTEIHPNERANEKWANELYRYMIEKGIITE